MPTLEEVFSQFKVEINNNKADLLTGEIDVFTKYKEQFAKNILNLEEKDREPYVNELEALKRLSEKEVWGGFGGQSQGFSDEARLAFLKALASGDKKFEIKSYRSTPWHEKIPDTDYIVISVDLDKMREVVDLTKYPELSASIQASIKEEEARKVAQQNIPKPSQATNLANELLGKGERNIAQEILDKLTKNQNQRQ